MNVAICDDESIQARLLASYVESWGCKTGRRVTVSVFPSAQAFWFAWCEDKSFDLLLLDIQMEGQNGVELAKELRKEDENLVILFVTGIPDYIGEGYEVNALHYLIKPVKEEKLFACLDRAAGQVKKAPSMVLLQCHGELLRLCQEEIVFVEAVAHNVRLRMQSTERELPLSISAMREKLSPTLFLTCHRSYLVNVMHITKITKTQVMLDCNEEVPLSRRMSGEVNRAFIDFYRRDSL